MTLSNRTFRKYTGILNLDDFQVFTDDGYVDIKTINKTIKYREWILKTNNFVLKCADTHIVFDQKLNEVFVKDLKIGDIIYTSLGHDSVVSITESDLFSEMYDLSLSENSNKRFYTNSILSHNSSCISESLSYVLFGKAYRAINKPQLVNSINNKNCVVTIEFDIGTIKYKVVRGIKPNVFEIWQNGIMLNQEAATRDYQQYLEQVILKLNHKTFHQIVSLGSSNHVPFMQLAAPARREVIEDLLDINIFTKMNVLVKERNSKLRELSKDCDNQIEIVKSKINLQEDHLKKIKSMNAEADSKKNEQIQSLQEEIERQSKIVESLSKTIESELPEVQTTLSKNNKKKEKLTKFQVQINDNIRRVVQEAKFYDNNSNCPTCSQVISVILKEEKINASKSKAQELADGLKQLNEELQTTNKSLEDVQEKLILIQKQENEVSIANASISSLNRQISVLQKVTSKNTSVDEAQALLEKTWDDKATLSELKNKYFEEKTYNEVITEMLKDTGIKTKIIKQYLPVMNKLINQYLATLDFFVSFHLDETFGETIKSRHRDIFTYSSFSEGEKQRINLSILMTWRTIARMKNSIATNLLIMDEALDTALDVDGTELLMQIIGSLEAGTNVFIISHKSEAMVGKFDSTIEFKKVNNFTQIEYI